MDGGLMRLHNHMHDTDCSTWSTVCQDLNEILPNTLLKGPRKSDLRLFTMFGWIFFLFLLGRKKEVFDLLCIEKSA